MNFIETIFQRLGQTPHRPVLREIRDGRMISATAGELLAAVQTARAFFVTRGVRKGDRCVLIAHNSIEWAVLDLAMMAEGITVVPLYARQALRELVGMMKDCAPSLICCGDEVLREDVVRSWAAAPPMLILDEVLDASSETSNGRRTPVKLMEDDAVTIIYTSGTSGEPKGVILSVGNLNHMLPCTSARLDALMGQRQEPNRVFHYLPFCFAGSWVLLLTCLSRNSILTISTDLTKLAEEMKLAAPHYFLNVPALLERLRIGIEDQLRQKGDLVRQLHEKGKTIWFRRHDISPPVAQRRFNVVDSLWLRVAQWLVYRAIKKALGPDLKALICGSAPLAKETQLFFVMIGLPVLQVYGLTETTAICTMDDPHHVAPGRVGPAIPGIEMRLGPHDEILVRGPNVFPGYWNRPADTEKVVNNGWFHTGDQGEVDATGNWRIIGRIKDLIVLGSGHNVAPEPIETMVASNLPGAQQVALIGNGRNYLSAIITGEVTQSQVEAALASLNVQLPHYKRIRAFHVRREPFTPESGLLTANGKLKRDAIAKRFREEIECLYRGGKTSPPEQRL